MPYTLTKADNETLIVLNDGQVDQVVTSLTLVGKNVSGYGGEQNENFIYLLENFANSSANSPSGQPRSPSKGQIWFDTNPLVNRPLIYDGNNWRPLAISLYYNSTTNTVVNATSNPNISYAVTQPGDFWVNSTSNQLFVITTGSNSSLVGPEAVPGFGETKMSSIAMYDIYGMPHPVIQTVIDGEIIEIFSTVTFITTITNAVAGFPLVNRGTTFKNYNSSTRYTTATTDVILHALHEQLDPSYPRRNINEHIQGNWVIDNGTYLYFGTTGTSSIAWTGTGLTFISTASFAFNTSNGNSLTFDGTNLYASTTANVGTSAYPFNTVYSHEFSAGSTSTQGYFEGVWNVTGNRISPNSDLGANLGSAGLRFNDVFATTLTTGGTGNVGTLVGTWEFTSPSYFGPATDLGANLGSTLVRFSNVYTAGLSAGSSANAGSLIGEWIVASGSTFGPSADTANDLGSSGARFGTLYTSVISGLGTVNGTVTFSGSPSIAGNLSPTVDNNSNLGSGALRWANGYIVNLTSSGIAASTGNISALTAGSGAFSGAISAPNASLTHATSALLTATTFVAGTANVTTLNVTTISAGGIGFTTLTDSHSNQIYYFDPDGTLSANTDANVSTQKAVKTYVDGKVSSLTTSINNEISRAEAAEGSLSAAIGDETSRASSIESSLSNAINSETARAEAAEALLVPSSSFAFGAGSPGYYILPGGFHMQWGTVNVTIGSQSFGNSSFSFSTAFPNSLFSCTVSATSNTTNPYSPGNNYSAIVWGESRTGANIRVDTEEGASVTGATVTVNYIAVGN